MGEIARRSLLGGLVAASVAAPARAAGWPERPIAWLLPFPAGGPTDAFSRPLGAYAGSKLGQTVVIDNRSGAGGTVAAAAVARAAPDGYTMLVGYTGLTYASQLYPSAGFDFGRDFAPISAFARVVQVLAINPARLDVTTWPQFIEAARKTPGGIDVASAGLGTVPHLAIEMLQARAGIKLNHVPYRGSAPAMQDLLAGQVDALFMPVTSVAGLARTG
ncbi:MAG: putative exported protein, partial [Reyranella sp.]|nr:putative exported protein [Reyranella sp.]